MFASGLIFILLFLLGSRLPYMHVWRDRVARVNRRYSIQQKHNLHEISSKWMTPNHMNLVSFREKFDFFFGNKKTRFHSASYRLSINEYKTAQDKTRQLKLEFIFRIESFFSTEMSMCLLLLLKDIVLFFTRKKVCLWFFFVAEIETTSKRFCAKSEGKRQKNRLYIELFIKIVTKTMSTLTSFESRA